MARSSMKTLPAAVQAAVIKAMEAGSTIDAIVDQLEAMGHQRSRSAVGRYAKEYGQMAAQQRDMRSAAEAFAGEFGGSENAEGKLLVQLLTSIGARMIMTRVTKGDAEDPDALEFSRLAKATKDLIGAAKTDSERDAKIREEGKKAAQDEMRSKLDAAGEAGRIDAAALAEARRWLGIGE